MKKKRFLIGIDVGGTKILTGLLDSNFRILATEKLAVDPHKGEKVFFESIVDSVDSVLASGKVKRRDIMALGMGCPGMIRIPEGIVTLSPNIAFLRNYPLRNRLLRRFKVPVAVENDVNAGLYGEYKFGAARNARHVFGIFLGTGVGGAMILDGELYHGASGGAGEIGHTFLNVPSLLHASDRGGTVESLTGRHAIASEAALLILKQQARELFKKAGTDTRRIKSKALLKAVQGGDTAVRELIVNKAQLIGIAMANVVNLLNPEVIVLGGGLVEAMGSLIVPVARATMKQTAMPPLARPVKVVAAKLGDYAIVKGAARLAYDAALEGKASGKRGFRG